MKKFLAIATAAMLMASMSLTAFAAESPGNGSSSGNTPSTSTSTSSSSSSSSSKKSSSHKSSGGGSGSASASSSKSDSKTTPAQKANMAVTAKYSPAQAVVTADGQAVAATVSVAAVPTETAAAFATVAQVFGVAVTDTFAYNAAGMNPSQPVLAAFAAGSVPAGSALLVVDAFGNLTIVTPVMLPDGTVTAVIPAACQIAVVAVPAVPAA